MKNIHVLPTPNPSRIISSNKEFTLLKNYTTDKRCQNIYITSDEEIKEGDWHLAWLRDSWEVLNYMPSIGYRKECLGKEVCKIILTTDQDLIKDGVHAIDDEFLEWFVKNPSCEEVEINSVIILKESRDETDYPEFDYYNYEIIIPKEEPNYNMKQETIAEMERLEEEPKQETLEEDLINSSPQEVKALIRHYKGLYLNYKSIVDRQERSYSEEDMREAFIAGGNSQIEEDDAYGNDYLEYMEDWFEQYKKK